MQWGVLAFIDVMGFKGMWRRQGASIVLEAVRRASERALRLADEQNSRDGGDLWASVQIEMRSFSDTIVLFAPLPPPTDWTPDDEPGKIWFEQIRRYMLLRYVVLLMSKLTNGAMIDSPPLLYRGCIAAGEFETNAIAFMGGAVDEAGEYFEAAEGAFVFLAPSALDVFKRRPGLLANTAYEYFVRYDVPLKREQSLKTYVLNPFLFRGDVELNRHIESILAYFNSPGPRGAVELKRANTAAFLKFVSQNWLWEAFPGPALTRQPTSFEARSQFLPSLRHLLR